MSQRDASPSAPSSRSLRLAGLVTTLGALGFVAVFVVLSRAMGYPDVLDLGADEVLPQLRAGGATLRLVWILYALVPFSIVLAAHLARGRLGLGARLDRATHAAGVVAGLAMSVGLARWPTLMVQLADAWETSEAPARAAIAARFDVANLVLGRFVGEFVGELALAAWLAGVGHALGARWVGRATRVLAGLLLVGAFRNVVPSVALVTEVTNSLLPLVLVWLGLSWLVTPRSDAALAAAA